MSNADITVYGAHWCPDCRRSKHYDNYHCVKTGDGSEYTANALLIATGSRYKRLVVSAAGEGSTAALMIREYLKGI